MNKLFVPNKNLDYEIEKIKPKEPKYNAIKEYLTTDEELDELVETQLSSLIKELEEKF